MRRPVDQQLVTEIDDCARRQHHSERDDPVTHRPTRCPRGPSTGRQDSPRGPDDAAVAEPDLDTRARPDPPHPGDAGRVQRRASPDGVLPK